MNTFVTDFTATAMGIVVGVLIAKGVDSLFHGNDRTSESKNPRLPKPELDLRKSHVGWMGEEVVYSDFIRDSRKRYLAIVHSSDEYDAWCEFREWLHERGCISDMDMCSVDDTVDSLRRDLQYTKSLSTKLQQ